MRVESRLIHTVIPPLAWTTTAYSGTPQPSFLELSALGEHLHLCRKCSDGRLAALHGLARTIQGFVATRFVTTLVVLGLVIWVGLMVR